MTRSSYLSFCSAAATWDFSYAATAKGYFHREGRRVLREVAKRLGLAPGSFTIRSNMGGVAVCGEVVLHSDKLYINLAAEGHPSNRTFWFRRVSGRPAKRGERYFSGPNHHMTFGALTDLDEAVKHFQEAAAESVPQNDHTPRRTRCAHCK